LAVVKSKFLSGVAVAALTLASGQMMRPAQAQSLPSWTGFYVGGYLGGAWGRSAGVTDVDCTLAGAPPAYLCMAGIPSDAPAVIAAGSGTATASGFTGGMQAGYLWQHDRLVYGLEGDFGAFRLNGSRQATGAYPFGFNGNFAPGDLFTVRSAFATDWLATFRGRIGWTIAPNWLAYATGGLALTELTVTTAFSDVNSGGGSANAAGTASRTMVGLAVGGGLEWMIDKRWSLKGEYLYVDFGRVTAPSVITYPAGGAYAQGLSTTADLTAHAARLGLNFRF
jgi:outer membrane immunogenic protein